MKRIIYLPAFLCLIVSCVQVKDIAYWQTGQVQEVLNSSAHDARIKPGDILSITVVSSEPAASSRYNLITPQINGTFGTIHSQPTLQNYLVDSGGDINFPSLGTIQVNGMSINELEDHIIGRLKPFFTEEMPVVTVRILNYTVNVLGEVHRPGKFEAANGRITIFEGLALAGDMTLYGRRDNVKVLRESDSGEKIIYTLNLNDNKLFDSPAYYLEQNDVVYVEPNRSRANSSRYGAAESYRITTLSFLISLATLGVAIFGLSR